MKALWMLGVSILLNVCGQLSMKQSLLNIARASCGEVHVGAANLFNILLAPLTLLGLSLYAVSAIFWIAALARVELSYAYPMLGIGYILVAILAWQLWGENMSVQRIVGTFVVAAGVWLVGTSG